MLEIGLMYLRGNLIGTDDDDDVDDDDGRHTVNLSIGQADRGFARSRCFARYLQ